VADIAATGGIPMSETNGNTAPNGLRGWWNSPPRSGLRRFISPWEYRRLRFWAGVRIVAAIVLVSLGLVTLTFGGTDWKTYWWTIAFLAAGAAQFAFAYWELRIARAAAS
jgi:hypothetical protein